MKSLILIWGNGCELLGIFNTPDDADQWQMDNVQIVKRYNRLDYSRVEVGVHYADMVEHLFTVTVVK